MTKRRVVITQSDITRAIRGLLAAGVRAEQIAGVKITSQEVVVLLGDKEPDRCALLTNEWDEVLK